MKTYAQFAIAAALVVVFVVGGWWMLQNVFFPPRQARATGIDDSRLRDIDTPLTATPGIQPGNSTEPGVARVGTCHKVLPKKFPPRTRAFTTTMRTTTTSLRPRKSQ